MQDWYKDAIIYEVHVRAFFDSVTDGIGDFGGLTQKLPYLEDLGVTAIWLLPFCPSPLKDDGYDISDYTDVHRSYGSLKDFQRFMREAKRRGLKVITELVLNHTSDQHLWFQRSRRAPPGSRWRDFYVWSDTSEKYRDARIIFKDFESSNWTWDPVAKAYFWHRFYSHQPDLNWENPEVRKAMFAAMDFWFDLGVDGLRLDAVPYLFEREGTNCENLPETHTALKELRKHVDEKYEGRMLLAEANQWPEDAVAYFGSGDECHMAFHFPIMPRLFMGLRMEDRHPITEILRITPPIPENCQWAMFLRNHDELTLEMVTDEERDYMYRTYAQERGMRINLGIRRRLAPLLENDRRRIELMNALLLSLPGTPVLYYGDEIGMGDNIYLGDRNGVRTPMQWSPDRNAGFSRANPQKLYLPVNIDPEYHYEALNVETQSNNSHSLLWWMKRMIAQRKQHPAFGRGKMDILFPSNRKILAFVREFEDEKILVVANLSRFTQCAELDLSRHREAVPVEVFGRNRFPAITEQPYLLSLGPHAFQWFHLQPREQSQESFSVTARPEEIPVLEVEAEEIFSTATRNNIAKLLPMILRRRSWFAQKHRTIRQVRVCDVIALPETMAHILLTTVEYTDGEPEQFTIPLSLATGDQAETVLREKLHTVLAKVKGLPDPQSILYGSVFDRQFNDALLKAMLRRRRIKGETGELVGTHTRAFREAWGRVRSNLEPQPQTLDAHKILVTLGQDFVFTLYREVEAGPNPDREIGEFLTNQTNFAHGVRTLGAIEYRVRQEDETEQVTTLGTLTAYARNAADGWMYTLDQLGLFFDRALAIGEDDPRLKELTSGTPFALSSQAVPRLITELLGGHAETAVLLGRCTAELHSALSSQPEMPDFAPEPFTEFYRHSLYHGLLAQMNKSLDALRYHVEQLSGAAQEEARAVLEQQDTLRDRFNTLRDMRMSGMRTRHHGDYHLGNVLYTGSDFIIKNFDGDYTRPMSERRIKRSPIKDVASMVRSLHYVSHAVLFNHVPGIVSTQDDWRLEKWAKAWYQWVSALFLRGYFEASGAADCLPQTQPEIKALLDAYTLEKGLVEVEYELEHRPDWVRIPLHGILEHLQ
ncbi:MAG TPA: maltose alpha-D-glucosyltransferase [Candidatus Angelobacter sp.]|nr:maltose alpha-D-glucosyltransferase [Candidatus Angelobacter sp.]